MGKRTLTEFRPFFSFAFLSLHCSCSTHFRVHFGSSDEPTLNLDPGQNLAFAFPSYKYHQNCKLQDISNFVRNLPILETNSAREMVSERKCLCSGPSSPPKNLHLSNCVPYPTKWIFIFFLTSHLHIIIFFVLFLCFFFCFFAFGFVFFVFLFLFFANLIYLACAVANVV